MEPNQRSPQPDPAHDDPRRIDPPTAIWAWAIIPCFLAIAVVAMVLAWT